MVLQVVGSLKSAAGVTTCALAMGYLGGGVVVEADPAGGDVAAWMGGWADVGLAGLAAAARRRIDPKLLAEHSRLAGYGVAVVTGSTAAEAAAGSVAAVVEVLPKLATDADVVVDVGRLDRAWPAAGLLPHAQALVLLVRPVAGDLARLAARLDGLRRVCRVKVVLAGPGSYRPGEVEETLGCQVAGVLPVDPRTAAVLAGGPGRLPAPDRPATGPRRWGRWPLLEAVSRL